MDELERTSEWFSDFRERVLAVLDDVDQIVPVDAEIVEWPEVGWHAFVGRLRTEDRPSFSLWLDTYLGKDESHHLFRHHDARRTRWNDYGPSMGGTRATKSRLERPVRALRRPVSPAFLTRTGPDFSAVSRGGPLPPSEDSGRRRSAHLVA